ncbi:MAG: phosphoribosyltransferase [Rhodobacteraceae bacterium]|nr:phosphoribosyltransferase [Paracoccaceae bacterium]
MDRFRDRRAAGSALADRLAAESLVHPVVLALPRGGVPVGLEVARRLGAPLDLVMVRKIGVPSQPELAVGAVVNGDAPETVVNDEIAAAMRLNRREIDALARVQLAEIARRRKIYLQGRGPVPIVGRTAIVIDDGIATGATMRAALRSVRRKGAVEVILAVPVAPPDTLAALAAEADGVVCLSRPAHFSAVGAFYVDFRQVEDAAVVEMLAEAARMAPDGRAGD